MDVTIKKPTIVVVIGWVFIVISVIVIFLGVLNLVFYYKAGFPSLGFEGSTLKLTSKNSPVFQLLEISRILLACFTIYVATKFLRLHSGARIALEITSWIILVYSISIKIYELLSVLNFGSRVADVVPGSSLNVYNAAAFVVVIIRLLLVSVPVIIGIKLLRSRMVRSAFNQQL